MALTVDQFLGLLEHPTASGEHSKGSGEHPTGSGKHPLVPVTTFALAVPLCRGIFRGSCFR